MWFFFETKGARRRAKDSGKAYETLNAFFSLEPLALNPLPFALRLSL